jgi:bisphosphoglycerate-independent phosphoglycerate mutase (AlkP superfamily)
MLKKSFISNVQIILLLNILVKPIWIFFIDKNEKPELKNGKLADLAPTILYWMGIEIPEVMNGEILIENTK